jgi:hypothetical protein
MESKGGEEKIFSVWWIVSIFAVVGFVVLGVSVFYSAEYDARLTEAKILNNNLADCLINVGVLQDEFFSSDNFQNQIYEFCNLDERLFGEGSDYFFRLNVSKESDKKIYGGRKSFEGDCAIYLNKTKGETLPRCVLKNETVIYKGENYVLEILTGSNNNGDREAKNNA